MVQALSTEMALALAQDLAELPPAPASFEAWEEAWRAHVSDLTGIGSDVSYAASIERFRRLIKSGLLRHTDITEHPERFIGAHRVLSELATSLGPGFWIRFTVHFNLFAGTVVALGSPKQVGRLADIQKKGLVGCFGLTEVLAGVNSGLVVNTTADWDPLQKMFCIHSPDEGAHKNWISQGLVADMCVVVADLRVGGKSFGPHAFLMELRKNGELVEGVQVGDMGGKTIGNDLDNAWISFNKVWVPKSALLNKYGDVEGDRYIQRVKGIRNMDMIGQRLYTGRCVIARSALVFTRQLYKSTRAYTDSKRCWAPKRAELCLSDIPQLATLFVEADKELSRMERFVDSIERDLSACLAKMRIPGPALVEAIAAAKVKAVETGIALCWKLKQEVGSYALMRGCGFEHLDYLQCCKFAEGDSRILMQKISRDRVKAFQKGFKGPQAEARCCEVLLSGKADALTTHTQVYELADAVISRTINEFGSNSKL